MRWAWLLKRVFDIDIEHCPNFGGALKITDPRPRRVRRRVESIYSKRSEEPKTACQRKPMAPLALSLT
jgi:hypothetical protein